jgi:predicted nucleotidyltransferase
MIENRRSELVGLCGRYGVRRLALFGSALRDDFDPGRSDLDLLVEFSPMSPQGHAEAYFGLLEDLESLFGRHVDLLELGAVRNPYLRQEIEEQQETLYAAA